jgi:GAF domain-containing protein
MNRDDISAGRLAWPTDQETPDILASILPWRQQLFGRILRVIAIVALPIVLVSLYYVYTTQRFWMIPLVVIGYVVMAAGAFLSRIPYTWRVWALLLPLLVLGASSLFSYGWGENGRIYLLTATLIATAFLGGRHGIVVLVASVLILTVFVVLVSVGVIDPARHSWPLYSPALLVTGLVVFTVCASALYVAFNTLFPRIFANLQRSVKLSEDLEMQQTALAERMRTLQEANLSLQRRAMYLDATAQVSQALMTVFDVEALLDQAVQLISRHFDMAYTAIYLPDITGTWLVLRAASSSAGRKLVAQGYRLDRSDQSVIVRVAETQRPHIATTTSDVAMDAAHFVTNPDLSTAHSAAVLPLVAGASGELLGVLDIHAAEIDFDQDDVRTLQGLAWQLAIALDNARRLGEEVSILETANPFYRLAGRLGATQTETDVYAVVLEIVQGFNPGHAYVVRAAHETGSLYLVTDLRGGQVNTQQVGDARAVGSDTEDFGTVLAIGAALQSPLLIADVMAIPALSLPGFHDFCAGLLERSENCGIALVPLRTKTEFFALLTVSYNVVHHFTPLETQLYRIIGELAGVTLDRIAVIREAQMQLGRERWLREFGERVVRIPDLEMMIAQAARSLQDVVQADGVIASIVLPESSLGNKP